jgi:hypothetical protein
MGNIAHHVRRQFTGAAKLVISEYTTDLVRKAHQIKQGVCYVGGLHHTK